LFLIIIENTASWVSRIYLMALVHFRLIGQQNMCVFNVLRYKLDENVFLTLENFSKINIES
jgi:hypothetical protein